MKITSYNSIGEIRSALKEALLEVKWSPISFLQLWNKLIAITFPSVFLLIGCGTITSKNSSPDFKVSLELLSLPGLSLSEESLPERKLVVDKTEHNQEKVELVQELVTNFNENQDELMVKLFRHFYTKAQGPFKVIVTSGIPHPYDAWTAKYKGDFAVFINLSEWNLDQLRKSGLGLIKHEVAHVLLEPLLKSPKPDDYLALLDQIVIDEGIAHYIGIPGKRSEYLKARVAYWSKAENNLKMAKNELQKDTTTVQRKFELLKSANTGPFWEKYGSIAGMYRADYVIRNNGIEGLVKAIRNSKLEVNELP